jgi:MFS family permease
MTPVETRRAGLIMALTCASQFMVILDAAIVNVALPSVRDDLDFTAGGLPWVVNAYLLTFAGFMLLGGRAADLFGHRRVLTAGLLLFSAASLVAGLAGTPAVLVAARAAQGVGAALLAPATLAVINTSFADAGTRARAFGAWSAAGGVGGMAGALAGGALTTGLSWRWVFLINVPIGAVLIALAVAVLARTRPGDRGSLDLAGAVTGTAGLAALGYGIMADGAVVPIAAGLVLLAAFVVVEARFATRPMTPLRLFRIRGVAVGTGMLLLFGAVPIAMWYFTSLYLQNVLGYTALAAGLGQTPAAVTFMVVARVAAGLRAGARTLVVAGSAGLVAGFGWLAGADPAYLTGVLGPTLVIAAGIGLIFPTLMGATTADAPEAAAGTVGGLATTASQVGGSIGLAVLATITGYDAVFLAAAGLGVVLAAAGVLLPPRG